MAVNSNEKSSLKKASGWNAFYQEVAPEILNRLGEECGSIGTVSTVASKMWKQLGSERRKDWRNEGQRRREDLDTGMVELKKKCEKSDRYFSRQKDLKYHQKGCAKSICCDCGQEFLHAEYLKAHILKERKKEYKCNECEKCFQSKRNLLRHQITHTKEKITCEVCGSSISSTSLKRHMKLKHT